MGDYMDIEKILGTINNQITTFTDSSGLPIGQACIYDIEYIIKAIIFIMTLSFVFKLILALIRRI